MVSFHRTLMCLDLRKALLRSEEIHSLTHSCVCWPRKGAIRVQSDGFLSAHVQLWALAYGSAVVSGLECIASSGGENSVVVWVRFSRCAGTANNVVAGVSPALRAWRAWPLPPTELRSHTF